MSDYTDQDRAAEVSRIRHAYVDRYVGTRLGHVEGNATNAEIEQWEKEAHATWRAKHPALNSLLIPHGSDVAP